VGVPVTTLLEGESGMRGPLPIATAIAPSPVIDAERVDQAAGANRAEPTGVRSELAGRSAGSSVGHRLGHPARHLAGALKTGAANPSTVPVHADEARATPPAFDSDNPYR
jgi:hypothetical protein